MMGKRTRDWTMGFFWLLTLLVLSACGGSSDGGGNDVASITGTGGGSNIGVVSSASSSEVTVNGIDQKVTETTTVTINGESGAVDQLSVGEVVVIDSQLDNTDNSHTITENIHYNSNVIGPITRIDQLSSSLTVLGQTIWVDNATILGEGLEFADLNSLQTIRVSGLVAGNGDVQATRIDVVDTQSYQIVGIAESVDLMAQTFLINEQRVDYPSEAFSGELVEGQIVRVKGILLESNNTFQATSVDVISLPSGNVDEVIYLEGLITDFFSKEDFAVSVFTTLADFDGQGANDTVIENGAPDDLSLDARIRIRGKLNTLGEIVAEHIFIVHTGPVSFEASVSESGLSTFTIESSDLDTGIWVTLTIPSENESSHLDLHVDKVEDNKIVNECSNWAVTSRANGLCYLENNGKTKWQIRVSPLSINSGNTDFQVNVYFRRASFGEPEKIETGTLTSFINQGDRYIYRLPTDQAPAGSFLAVSSRTLQNAAQIVIQGDGVGQGAGNARLYDCQLGSFAHGEAVKEPTCWLPNDGVNNWYISLEASATSKQILNIEFITPVALALGESINDTVSSRFDNLYKVSVPEGHRTMSALLSEMMESSSNNNMELYIREGLPPFFYVESCAAYLQKDLRDEQCITSNDHASVSDWYILVAGDEGTTYNLEANASTQSLDEQPLSLGQTVMSSDQEAGAITRYRVPKGEVGSAFVAVIQDLDSADFELYVTDRPFEKYFYSLPGQICKVKQTKDSTVDIDKRICRAYTEDYSATDVPDFWYLTVKSARAGRYILSVDEQQIIELEVGQPFPDQITDVGARLGMLYSVIMPQNTTRFTLRMIETTGLTSIVGLAEQLPSSEMSTIGGREFFSAYERSFTTAYGSDDSWFILVSGDQGAEYSVLTEFE